MNAKHAAFVRCADMVLLFLTMLTLFVLAFVVWNALSRR
jgi:hypothetical protein